MAKKKSDDDKQLDELTAEAQPEITLDELIDKLSELQNKAEQEAKRADEMRNTAMRLQAEFDNYRKRTNETNKRVRDDGRIDVLTSLMPVLDVVTQAMSMIKDESVRKGIQMIETQMLETLTAFGVERMDTDGADFDPALHEAILQVDAEDESEKDTIKQTVQAGYVLGERIIRAAKVVVAK